MIPNRVQFWLREFCRLAVGKFAHLYQCCPKLGVLPYNRILDGFLHLSNRLLCCSCGNRRRESCLGELGIAVDRGGLLQSELGHIMKITKLHIHDFQQFRDFELDFTDPKTGLPLERICLIGRNGTGKSTLLSLMSYCLHGLPGRAVRCKQFQRLSE